MACRSQFGVNIWGLIQSLLLTLSPKKKKKVKKEKFRHYQWLKKNRLKNIELCFIVEVMHTTSKQSGLSRT